MARVILFHHALGLTKGVMEFAERIRGAGHEVVTPDLYDGEIFQSLDAGVAYAEKLGFYEIIKKGAAMTAAMPVDCIYAGFSLGALPAQMLAQTRAGTLGAILYHGGVPIQEFGSAWPEQVALQMHLSEGDKWTELAVVQQLARDAKDSEAFIYPGSAHLVTDSSFSEHDAVSAELILKRSIQFLNRWG